MVWLHLLGGSYGSRVMLEIFQTPPVHLLNQSTNMSSNFYTLQMEIYAGHNGDKVYSVFPITCNKLMSDLYRQVLQISLTI